MLDEYAKQINEYKPMLKKERDIALESLESTNGPKSLQMDAQKLLSDLWASYSQEQKDIVDPMEAIRAYHVIVSEMQPKLKGVQLDVANFVQKEFRWKVLQQWNIEFQNVLNLKMDKLEETGHSVKMTQYSTVPYLAEALKTFKDIYPIERLDGSAALHAYKTALTGIARKGASKEQVQIVGQRLQEFAKRRANILREKEAAEVQESNPVTFDDFRKGKENAADTKSKNVHRRVKGLENPLPRKVTDFDDDIDPDSK